MRRPVYPVIARLAFPNNWNFGDRVWKALRDIRAFGGGEREIGSVNGPYSVNSNWNEWRERSTLAVGRNVKYRLGGGAIDWMVTSLVTLDPCSRTALSARFLGKHEKLSRLSADIRSRLCPYTGTDGWRNFGNWKFEDFAISPSRGEYEVFEIFWSEKCLIMRFCFFF